MSRELKFLGLSILVALFAATDVRSELLLFYDFNDAANADSVKDLSGKGNNGDLLAHVDEVPVYTPDKGGHSGKAGDRAVDLGLYSVNGTNVGSGAYVEVTSAADGAFSSIVDNDSFTLSLWVKGNEEQPAPQWTFYAGPGRQFGSHTPWSDGTIYFDVAGCCGPTQRINLEADPSMWDDGGWNHYAFVKDATYTAIYHNGELFHDSGEDEKAPLSDITELFVGSGPEGDRRSYSGQIDDFAIWDNVLAESDIKKIFEGTFQIVGGVPGVKGDFDASGSLDVADINLLTAEVLAGTNKGSFDLNADNKVNGTDRTVWVNDLKKTYFGDANLDREFNSGDFVAVFTVGKYETGANALWQEGDWDGSGKFDSGDFVAAFTEGGYEKGPHPAVNGVPEPSALVLFALGLVGLIRHRRGGK